MTKELAGKIAFVTGSGRGLGVSAAPEADIPGPGASSFLRAAAPLVHRSARAGRLFLQLPARVAPEGKTESRGAPSGGRGSREPARIVANDFRKSRGPTGAGGVGGGSFRARGGGFLQPSWLLPQKFRAVLSSLRLCARLPRLLPCACAFPRPFWRSLRGSVADERQAASSWSRKGQRRSGPQPSRCWRTPKRGRHRDIDDLIEPSDPVAHMFCIGQGFFALLRKRVDAVG